MPLPASLAGRRIAIVSEQGLGDMLFFLRFARDLRDRSAALALRCDGRLHGMLARTGLFALGISSEGTATEGCEPVPAGDLPWLAGASDPARFPPLTLAPSPERLSRARATLESLGPAPHIALTWRGGIASAGPARTQLKQIDPAVLGGALRGVDATWISVQRLPQASERERLSDAIGARVHDLSTANDDLEDMLALMAAVDRYAGVSNANIHLRAGVGGDLDVLVPHPPEWRWAIAGCESPWFPRARVHRQEASGDWSEALESLRAALTSPAAP